MENRIITDTEAWVSQEGFAVPHDDAQGIVRLKNYPQMFFNLISHLGKTYQEAVKAHEEYAAQMDDLKVCGSCCEVFRRWLF